MSQKRIWINGQIYSITTKTFGNLSVFDDLEYGEILLDNIKYYKSQFEFKLLAYCILPDHLHLLIWPSFKYSISKIMQSIKYRTASDIRKYRMDSYCKLCNKTHVCSRRPDRLSQCWNDVDEIGTIWQKSFYDRIIRSDRQLQNTIDYIDYNAVHHNLVSNPIDWLYSSFHNRYQTGKERIKIDFYE